MALFRGVLGWVVRGRMAVALKLKVLMLALC